MGLKLRARSRSPDEIAHRSASESPWHYALTYSYGVKIGNS